MSAKKVFAVAVILAPLVAIYSGILYVNHYTGQITTYDVVSTDSVVVPPNGYGHISVQLNSSDETYYVTPLKKSNGTIRVTSLSKEYYEAWINRSYKPTSWYEESNQAIVYVPFGSNLSPSMHYIFWNPDSPVSKEVTFQIFRQQTETVYDSFSLEAGISLIAAGAVTGLAAAFTLGRRVFIVVIALTMFISGICLISANMQLFQREETVATSFLTVPADSYTNEHIHYNVTGIYGLILNVDNATVNDSMNATVVSEDEFAAMSQGQYEPYWQRFWTSQYLIGGTNVNSNSPNDMYLVLSNPDAFDKQVTVQVERFWEEYNYLGVAGGIALVTLAVITLYIANRGQIREFNKALENQE